MSAPPMGMTIKTPKHKDSPRMIRNRSYLAGLMIKIMPRITIAVIMKALSHFWPVNKIGLPEIFSLNLPQAIALPVTVKPPITMDK